MEHTASRLQMSAKRSTIHYVRVTSTLRAHYECKRFRQLSPNRHCKPSEPLVANPVVWAGLTTPSSTRAS